MTLIPLASTTMYVCKYESARDQLAWLQKRHNYYGHNLGDIAAWVSEPHHLHLQGEFTSPPRIWVRAVIYLLPLTTNCIEIEGAKLPDGHETITAVKSSAQATREPSLLHDVFFVYEMTQDWSLTAARGSNRLLVGSSKRFQTPRQGVGPVWS